MTIPTVLTICCLATIAVANAHTFERRVLSTGAADPKTLFNLVDNEEAVEVDREELLNGKTMITYQLTYHGVPIWEGKEVVIYDPKASLPYSISEDGYYVNDKPTIAESLFSQDLPASSVSEGLCKEALNFDQDVKVTYDSKRWLFIDDDAHTAAIHDRVRVVRADDQTKVYCCIIDPIAKEVIVAGPERLNIIKTYPVGNAKQGYRNVTVDIQVDTDGQCKLVSSDGKLAIYDAHNTQTKPADPIKFPCDPTPNDVFQGALNQAIDAFDLVMQTKTCLEQTVGFDKFWNIASGTVLRVYTHWGVQWVNAQYAGDILCGDGYPDSHFPFCSAPTTVAHEIGHGVLSVNGVYKEEGKENGCIHEGFADITADMVNYCMYGNNPWLVSDQMQRLIGASYFNISDPYSASSFYRNYVSTMDSHDCGNIIHRAFFLLATTPGWNTPKAYKIFYGGMKNYWGQAPTFRSAECGILQYAKVNGLSTQELADIVNAFAADDVKVDSQCALFGQVPDPTTTTTLAPGSMPTQFQSVDLKKYVKLQGVKDQIFAYKLTITGNEVPGDDLYLEVGFYQTPLSFPAIVRMKYNSVPTSFDDFTDGLIAPPKANWNSAGMVAVADMSCVLPGDYYVLVKLTDAVALSMYAELSAASDNTTCPILRAASTGLPNTLSANPPIMPLNGGLKFTGPANQIYTFKVTYKGNEGGNTLYFSLWAQGTNFPAVMRLKSSTKPTSFNDYENATISAPQPNGSGTSSYIYISCMTPGDYYVMIKFTATVYFQMSTYLANYNCPVTTTKAPTPAPAPAPAPTPAPSPSTSGVTITTIALTAQFNINGVKDQLFIYKATISSADASKILWSYLAHQGTAPLPAALRIKYNSPPTSFDDYHNVDYRAPYLLSSGYGMFTESYVYCPPAGDYYFMVKFSADATVEFLAMLYQANMSADYCPTYITPRRTSDQPIRGYNLSQY